MKNAEFGKGVIIVSLCLILLLTFSLFAILYPAPAHSLPSQRLHIGYKPHPQDSGYHGMAVSESRFQSEPVGASMFDAPGEKDFGRWRFPELIPALSFSVILGFLILLRIGTTGKRNSDDIENRGVTLVKMANSCGHRNGES